MRNAAHDTVLSQGLQHGGILGLAFFQHYLPESYSIATVVQP